MGYVNGYYRRDGTYVRGHNRRGANEGGDAFVILALIVIVLIPIACAYWFIKKISESRRWKHATRAAIATCLAVPAALIAWIAVDNWNDEWDAMVSLQNRPVTVDAYSQDGLDYYNQYGNDPNGGYGESHAELIESQQKDLTEASDNANGTLVFAIPLGLWAAAEWMVAVRRVRQRDTSLGTLRRLTHEAQERLDANRVAWDAARDEYLMTARACAINPDPAMPAAASGALNRYMAAAKKRETHLNELQQARQNQREAECASTTAASEVEENWRDVCIQLANVEAYFQFIEEQVYTHTAAMQSYPALFTPADLQAMRVEANFAEQQALNAREMFRRADEMRRAWT